MFRACFDMRRCGLNNRYMYGSGVMLEPFLFRVLLGEVAKRSLRKA